MTEAHVNDPNPYAADLAGLHADVHRQLREAITGLDGEVLTWTPGPDTSSIGTIVTHAVGAEAEMLRNLLGIPTARERASEFAARSYDQAGLLRLIESAEQDWKQLGPRLGDAELRTAIPRPNKPQPQSGLYWLARNYGHLREHLAQVQLTRQLYEHRHTGAPDSGSDS